MRLNTKALAIACGILWGAVMFYVSLANLIWGSYGQQCLQVMSSVYPGYHATRNVAQVIVGTLYGVVDGFFGGLIFAWLYNRFTATAS
ncbi:MAG TPA: bacteriophage holin [Terriglobales bacterium]|nr:bacteriophage holin [Terriglobales bacterium]